ncbi:hypothetical protein MW887_002728 [Aspergillus wentii]|nr:hypothetical protein MW887_002728 [Aspergillus wentii]
MASRSRSRLLFALALPPVAVGYGIHRGLTTLETKYPSLSPESTTSQALSIPRHLGQQHCPHIHVHAARVPVSALRPYADPARKDTSKLTSQDLQFAWARALIGSPLLRNEARIAGLFTNGRISLGDMGHTAGGFSLKTEDGSPRQLLNGVIVVQRPPGEEGLLGAWIVPDGPRELFEKISRWGYSSRLMSSGRHETSVSEPFEGEGEDKANGPFVEVRLASAHDYEIFPEEGNLQKMIPAWLDRLHRGYARWILHKAVCEVQQNASERGS